MADRIKQRMLELDIKQEELGKAAGLTQPAIFKLLSGKTRRTTRLAEIAQALEVRPDWLVTGEGPMQGNDLAADERQLVEGYRALSPIKKAAALTLIAQGEPLAPTGRIQIQAQGSAGQAQTQ